MKKSGACRAPGQGAGEGRHRIVSFSGDGASKTWRRQKQKQKKPVRKGRRRSCLLTPAYAATDPPDTIPDCPSSRLPSYLFVACVAPRTPATPAYRADRLGIAGGRSGNTRSILRSLGHARKLRRLGRVCGRHCCQLTLLSAAGEKSLLPQDAANCGPRAGGGSQRRRRESPSPARAAGRQTVGGSRPRGLIRPRQKSWRTSRPPPWR